MNLRHARMQGEKLFDQLGNGGVPVDVEGIARSLGLEVIYADLGDGNSGLLISDGATAQICVEESESSVRQRFTIAHEIGHYSLRHQFENGEHVHVDKGNYISQRGPTASDGSNAKEIEANQFAAALLMPSNSIRQWAAKFAGDDKQVSRLSEMFNVSEQAMTIRLTSLGLI